MYIHKDKVLGNFEYKYKTYVLNLVILVKFK
jgi:hypothetical protein